MSHCSLNSTCFTKKYNRLLHRDEKTQSKGQIRESSTKAALNANACSGLLQVVAVRLSNGGSNVDTLAVCDTGSTLFFIDEEIKTQLGTEGTKLTLIVAAISGTKEMASERVPVKVVAKDHEENDSFHVHARMYLENQRYDYLQIKQIRSSESTSKQSSSFERHEICHW